MQTKGNFNLINTIVDPLSQNFEIEKDYAIFETLALANFLVWYELLETSIEHANDENIFQLRISSLGDKFLATFLMFAWILSACCLEGLFHLANVKIVVLNSSVKIIPWDPGKHYAFMAKVGCDFS
jgi:hypothetical protein